MYNVAPSFLPKKQSQSFTERTSAAAFLSYLTTEVSALKGDRVEQTLHTLAENRGQFPCSPAFRSLANCYTCYRLNMYIIIQCI